MLVKMELTLWQGDHISCMMSKQREPSLHIKLFREAFM